MRSDNAYWAYLPQALGSLSPSFLRTCALTQLRQAFVSTAKVSVLLSLEHALWRRKPHHWKQSVKVSVLLSLEHALWRREIRRCKTRFGLSPSFLRTCALTVHNFTEDNPTGVSVLLSLEHALWLQGIITNLKNKQSLSPSFLRTCALTY